MLNASFRCLTTYALVTSLSGCAAVSVATTAVSLAGTAVSVGVTAGSIAVGTATTAAKGAVGVGTIVVNQVVN